MKIIYLSTPQFVSILSVVQVVREEINARSEARSIYARDRLQQMAFCLRQLVYYDTKRMHEAMTSRTKQELRVAVIALL